MYVQIMYTNNKYIIFTYIYKRESIYMINTYPIGDKHAYLFP